MSQKPLITIICTCYNQEKYIEDALKSAVGQSYQNIELVIIDDCSTDDSSRIINSFLEPYPDVTFLQNSERRGLCKNFNRGLEMTSGEFVVDLSGDDVLCEDRIERQVSFFEKLNSEYGVIYSNAQLITEEGFPTSHFYDNKNEPPSGDIYIQLIEYSVVVTQTMLMRRKVLEELGGYDEELAYEDFDFWVRSSRNWKYAYQNEVLTKIRKTPGSLSTKQYEKEDPQLHSTFQVCRKIKSLNRNDIEDQALVSRLKYEIKHAVLAEKKQEAELFIEMLSEMQDLSLSDVLFKELNNSAVKTAWLRKSIAKVKRSLQ